jgi:tRNA A-37 threonylcarbamoyl transferase component Bud32
MSDGPEEQAPAAHDQRLAPGTMVGAYRIEKKLGQGGVGAVFAAEEPTIKKRVAIKVLRRALADDEAMVARFEREARAVNEIRHPGIIDVFGFGKLDDGRPYLVMSLLEGESLRAALQRRERLPPEEAWRIARDVAEALEAAHAAGIVHRDLKPDNVFLERAGPPSSPTRVKVLDFGIAKVVSSGADPMKLTETGVPLGTPAYMAPEQWWATPVSPRTDQYALGVMLFEMLAGRPPFVSQHFPELVQMHVNEPAPTLASFEVLVSPAVEAVVARLLAKAADARFASMSDVIAEGDRAFSNAPPAPAQEPPAPVPAEIAPAPEAPSAEAGPVHPSAGSALQRYFSLHAAIVILGPAAVIAVGYGGAPRHDVIEWMHIGGLGQWPVVVWLPVAAIAFLSLARRRAETADASNAPFWIALAPALLGAFATYTGWKAILHGMPRAPALDQLRLFSAGTHEANACRFLGFSLGALLFLSVAAMPGVSGLGSVSTTLATAPGVRSREAFAASALLAAIAVVAAFLGAPSGALIAGTAAVAIVSCALLPTVHAETAARDELERAAAGVLAVGLAVAAGITRIEADEASFWGETSTRAERVAGILASQRERDVTLPIAVVSLAILAGIEIVRLVRLQPARVLSRPRAGTMLLAFSLAMGALGDVVQHGRFADKRAELRAELDAQFALFSKLDPPPGDALDPKTFIAHRATGLQVTRDVLAVDGHGSDPR